ncbi:MAG: ABC transporter permease [Lachnospiraceae bacterium]|nr:ABC transporter permease [Lachnospiraceae bacterium]
MRLYKMELYKLCCRKSFIIGAVCTMGRLLLFFLIKVADECTYVDGIRYEGFQAVQVNRQIIKEYQGVLTDEKVRSIVEKYGFPGKVDENTGYREGNYLNEFVEFYLSDGYCYNWDDYKLATRVYPIADTDLGEAVRLTGKDIVLGYTNGWSAFSDVLQVALLIGGILVLIGISPVFANERQTKMLQLLFTSKDGLKKNICAKIAAALTVGFCVWFGIVVIDLLLCGMVYGFGGLKCLAGIIRIGGLNTYVPITMLSIGSYITVMLLRTLLGFMLLCAVTLCISAYFKSTFSSIVTSMICFGMPVLMFILFNIFYNLLSHIIVSLMYALPVYSSPIYSILYPMDDCRSLRGVYVFMTISAAEFFLFLAIAYRIERRLIKNDVI